MGSVSRRSTSVPALVLIAVLLAAQAPSSAATGDVSRGRTFVPSPSSPAGAGSEEDETVGVGGGAPLEEAQAPETTLGFDAIGRTSPVWPADPTGAIGRDWFFTAVNSSYALYDLDGTAVVGPSSLRPLFVLPTGTRVFDPKVVYDQFLDTFVLVFLGVNDRRQRSWILIVSVPNSTADDTSTWCGTKVLADRTSGDGPQFADYPGLGYDREHVVVTTNRFDFVGRGFRGAQVMSFGKDRLYDCGETVAFDTLLGKRTRNPDGSLAFTIQPAASVGPGNTLYMLSYQPGRPNFVVLWRLRETSGGPSLRRAAIEVPKVGIGPYATQGGGSLTKPNTWWDPGDLRIVNAFADLDRRRVYGAHVIAKDFRPDTITDGYVEAGIRWYEIRPARRLAASKLTRFGNVGAAETDAGWPTLATDAVGNLFITYNRASAVTREFLSAWAAEVVPGSTKATTSQLASGTARMEAVQGPERWGDYNGISRDPVTGSLVAMVNQYAASDGSGPTRDWQQTVHLVQHG